MTVAEAQSLATNIGLGTVSATGTVETPDAGLVDKIASQAISPGTSVPVGTNVDVTVYIPAP